jgi:lipid A 3-O-deacylase
LIQYAQALTQIAVCSPHADRPRLYRPFILALTASALALYPLKSAYANPLIESINGTEEIRGIETVDLPIPDISTSGIHGLLNSEIAPTPIHNSHPEMSSDFPFNPSPASFSVSSPDVILDSSLDDSSTSPSEALLNLGLKCGGAAQPPPHISDLRSATPPSDSLADASSETLLDVSTDIPAELPEMPLKAQVESSEDISSDPIPFGRRGMRRWYVHGGGATTLDNDPTRRLGFAGAGISHFFINGHSINLELNGMAFDQSGDNAVGLNLAALLRWHFVRQQNWSLYIDGGAGILGTTNPVPSDGTRFNFTPQVGGGVTIRLDDRKRLMLGLRWHHISNADLYENNPGRDSILGYVGVSFPR